MVADEKHKQVNLDIATYETIKSNGAKANRSIAGEIRQMLAIVTAPEKGTETVIGVARVTRQDGVTTIDDAEGKELVALGRFINHEPAHAPVEAMDSVNVAALQSVEEKE